MSPRALRDIDFTVAFMGTHSSKQALEWLKAIRAAIKSLSRFPERCPLARETNVRRGEKLRQLVMGTHRIVFRIRMEERVVEVLHVRHGSRLAAGEVEAEE